MTKTLGRTNEITFMLESIYKTYLSLTTWSRLKIQKITLKINFRIK